MSTRSEIDPALLASLQQAWMQALDCTSCDITDSWEQAGGDSLATLHLLLQIEQLFGRTLSYEDMAPDMHVQDLAALLARGASAPESHRPLVHLVPGMFGDEPRLAILRRALADHIHFQLIELPDMSESATMLRDLALTGAFVAGTIQRQQPEGAILLAGFSFGACVAFEAARVLSAAGREIGLLGLFDGPLGFAAQGQKRALWRWFGPRTLLLSAIRWAGSWQAGRRALLKLMQRRALSAWLAVYKLLCEAYRQPAIEFWSPPVLQQNVWLVVSEELACRTLATWRRLCPRLRVVAVPGRHLDIFYPPAADIVFASFLSAINAAREPAPADIETIAAAASS
ncbi:MAG TPA: thioesterase domain-containing protein [Steroidobacteraceae bacterium]|jgi:thioesterase domain-containing protein/acyl carrier protein